MEAHYFLVTIVLVSIMLSITFIQLMLMAVIEGWSTTARKARIVVYALVVFTLAYRLWLYTEGEALVTPAGLGIGTTATLAMIVLEYIRAREVS